MKAIKIAILSSVLLSGSTAFAQNINPGSYSDALLDNSFGYASGDVLSAERLSNKQKNLLQTAAANLKAKDFAQAASQFDAILNSPMRIASQSPSKITYYLAGVSHYLAGNDIAALPLLRTAVRSPGLDKQQREFSKILITDITAQ